MCALVPHFARKKLTKVAKPCASLCAAPAGSEMPPRAIQSKMLSSKTRLCRVICWSSVT